MSTNPKSTASNKKRKKKKTDPFWPIVIILSILAFTGSFWFFYMLTSKINTRTFPTTETPKLMLTPTPDVNLQGSGTLMIGDHNNPASGSPEDENQQAITTQSGTPEPVSVNHSVAPSPAPERTSPTPSPAATSSPVPTPTPRPTATPRPVATPTPEAKTSYRVQVGSYTSRETAQSAASQLSEKGYTTSISEDNGRFRIQIGVYDSQESALSLAEEVTQQGYEVVVRKVTL